MTIDWNYDFDDIPQFVEVWFKYEDGHITTGEFYMTDVEPVFADKESVRDDYPMAWAHRTINNSIRKDQ